jgi:hypothetical protein
MSKQRPSLSPQIETYTYYEDTKQDPMEVLLVGIDTDTIGSENSFQPPGFNKHHITTWLRKRYFFLNGNLYAQVPRRSIDFPAEAIEQLDFEDGFATDVSYNSEDEKVNVFYPLSSSDTLILTWDIGSDHWSMRLESVPTVDGNIDTSSLTNSERIWSSP